MALIKFECMEDICRDSMKEIAKDTKGKLGANLSKKQPELDRDQLLKEIDDRLFDIEETERKAFEASGFIPDLPPEEAAADFMRMFNEALTKERQDMYYRSFCPPPRPQDDEDYMNIDEPDERPTHIIHDIMNRMDIPPLRLYGYPSGEHCLEP